MEAQFIVPPNIDFQLPDLFSQRLQPLLQFLASPLVLLQLKHTSQIGVGQPLYLLFHTHACFAQILTPCLQFLGKPQPTLRPLKCDCNQLGMRENCTHILPYHLIELLRCDIVCRAFLIPMRDQRLTFAQTDIIGVSSAEASAITGEMTQATTDQGTQYIRISRVVAAGKLLIMRQFRLHLVKLPPFSRCEEPEPLPSTPLEAFGCVLPCLDQWEATASAAGGLESDDCGPDRLSPYRPDWLKSHAPWPDSTSNVHSAWEAQAS